MDSENWEFHNTPSIPKAGYVLIVISLLLLLAWFSVNQPRLAAQSIWYFNLGAFALVIFAIDFMWEAKSGDSIISTSFWESESPIFGEIGGMKLLVLFVGSLLFAGIIFISIVSTKASIVGTPTTFQIVDLGLMGNIVVTIASCVMENVVFFYIVGPTIFGLILYLTKSPIFAIIAAIFLNGIIIFPFYHLLTYGLTDLTAMVSVATFALLNTSVTLIVRNSIFSDTFHIANNLAVMFAKTVKVGFSIVGG